ncbi:MAG: hypothetical protein K6A42_08075 [Treponema sp.]|nr:hypothetical protein [Treponema sp.]
MELKIKSKIFSFLKFAGFIAACVVTSIVVIAPLWLFASKKPELYSALVLAAAAIFVLRKIIVSAKKAGVKRSLFFAAKLLVVAAGFLGAYFSLVFWQRILFIVSVIAAIILFQILCRVEKNAKKVRA